MTRVEIADGRLVVRPVGLHKLWAFKRQIEVPTEHVEGAARDPEDARRWAKGLRLPGTAVPWVIVAGSYYRRGEWTFYDVRPRHMDRAVVIRLRDERYARPVVEVEDPATTVAEIERAVHHRPDWKGSGATKRSTTGLAHPEMRALQPSPTPTTTA